MAKEIIKRSLKLSIAFIILYCSIIFTKIQIVSADACLTGFSATFTWWTNYEYYLQKADDYQKYTSWDQVKIQISWWDNRENLQYSYSCIPQEKGCSAIRSWDIPFSIKRILLDYDISITTWERCIHKIDARTYRQNFNDNNQIITVNLSNCYSSDTIPYQSKKQGTRKIWIKVRSWLNCESDIFSTDTVINYTHERPTIELNDYNSFSPSQNNQNEFTIHLIAKGAILPNGDIWKNHEIISGNLLEELNGILRFDSFSGRLITNQQ